MVIVVLVHALIIALGMVSVAIVLLTIEITMRGSQGASFRLKLKPHTIEV